MKDTDHAIVRLPAIDQVRPAAHVFRLEGGAAWVEPAYLDPNGATMATFHRIDGQVHALANGFTVTAPDGLVATFAPATAANDDPEGTCRLALADYTDLLVEQDLTQEGERARLQLELADDLAPAP